MIFIFACFIVYNGYVYIYTWNQIKIFYYIYQIKNIKINFNYQLIVKKDIIYIFFVLIYIYK